MELASSRLTQMLADIRRRWDPDRTLTTDKLDRLIEATEVELKLA
jgi:hypothetical protein